MTVNEDPDGIAEKLTTAYGIQVSRDVIASAFTTHPKLPLLLSRSSFRPNANDRPQRRSQMRKDRRNFIRGMIGLAVISISALTILNMTSGSNSQPQSTTEVPSNPTSPTNPSPTTSNPPTPTNPPSSALQPIANASNIPLNGSATYNDPSYGPVLLIHLDNGQFVAYSPICTHAGCQVEFNPSGKDIVCPCHGAVYDPYHSAQVLGGPAPYPLQRIPIRYDTATGNIYLNA